MALLLVPYTNAMRLGQGFNSYTQQICVDDAVLVNPSRPENIVTNDGTTMRIVAELAGKPSAWSRIKENVKVSPLSSSPPTEAPPEKSAGAIENADPEDDAGAIEGTEHEDDVTPNSSLSVVEDLDPSVDVLSSDLDDDDSGGGGEHRSAETRAGPQSASKESNALATGVRSVTLGEDKATEPSSGIVGRVRVGDEEASPPAAGHSSKSNKDQVAEVPSRVTPNRNTTLRHQKGGVAQKRGSLSKQKQLALVEDEKRRMDEQRLYQRQIEIEKRREQTQIRKEEAKERADLRAEKRKNDKARREALSQAIKDAMALNKGDLTLDDLNKIKAQNQFADRFYGIMKEDKQYHFDPSTGCGTSQTVTYTSRFIDKLSDITEDMCISGALTIKAAKIGGSGRGSFIDSDKFKESDMSYYISVKVINQTVNFKDALEFNQLRPVGLDSSDFNKVYGDSFISGFVEGGEFNAVVSMKVHNKAKMLDIKAEAKVALTAGPVDIEAQANVGIARSNLETNTETTMMVSWCGGGSIKPMDQPWNIQSIMEAAARFPDLVAHCPQRTYGILTKYETLRSFVTLKPAAFSALQYENAQMYTNVLMDAFMTYKSIYKKLGDESSSIKNKTLEFEPVDPAKAQEDKTAAILAAAAANESHCRTKLEIEIRTGAANGSKVEEAKLYLAALTAAADITKFEASMKGLGDARTYIRRQMLCIVNEVDKIEADPKIATDQDHEEPFQSPLLFEDRLPAVRIPLRLQPKSHPLGGRRIMAKTQTEGELLAEQESQEAENKQPLYTKEQDLTTEETTLLDKIMAGNPGIGAQLRVSRAVPKDRPQGENVAHFNNLEYLFPEWQVERITIGIAMGRVVSVEIKYVNGLLLQKGILNPKAKPNYKTLKDFQKAERITSAAIEVGTLASEASTEGSVRRVLSICMYTTRGRRLLGQAATNQVLADKVVRKDGVEYKDAQTTYIDASFSSGTFKGFFGWFDMDRNTGGLQRIGVIWGDDVGDQPDPSVTVQQVAPVYNTDESSAAEDNERLRREPQTAEDRIRSLEISLKETQKHECNLITANQLLQNILRANSQSEPLVSVDDLVSPRLYGTFKNGGLRLEPSGAGSLSFDPSDTAFFSFDSCNFHFPGHGNTVDCQVNGPMGAPRASRQVDSDNRTISLRFKDDGKLFIDSTNSCSWYLDEFEGDPRARLMFSNTAPYIEILSNDGDRLWSSSDSS
ncbi:nucleoporin GLE1 [Microdochium nivale]|nr:nucleoporin GLE1 [Microdochium nivale]